VYLFTNLHITEYVNVTAYDDDAGTLDSAVNCASTADADVGTDAVYTVCLKKNIPDIFSYNSRKHCRIFIIFGRRITEKVGNQ